MILGQPFSRSNRSYRSWSTVEASEGNQQPSTGARGSASTSTMPRKPPSSTCQHSSTTYAAFSAAADQPNQGSIQQHPQPLPMARSATLSRANLDRAKRLQFASTAIGKHQEPKQHPPMTPVSSIYSSHQPFNSGTQLQVHPKEVYRWRSQPEAQQFESQHYAATSFTRGTPVPPSESGRSCKSGRESVLSGLFDRFETLRRRTGWSRNSSRRLGRPPSTNSNQQHNQKQSNHHLKADEIYAEGSVAIDGNISKRNVCIEADIGDIEEGKIRGYIDEKSMLQPEFRLLVTLLTNWINDELAHQRIIVRDLTEDLYDGQVLGKLFEKLHGVKIDVVEVTQNAETQRHKLSLVLTSINRVLSLQARWASIRWSVEGINGKNLVEILHLLIALARYYRAPIELPPSVSVEQQTIQRVNGQILRRTHQVLLTGSSSDSLCSATTSAGKRDAFDVLFDSAPEKLVFVQQSLMRFCNRHLNKIDMSCSPSSLTSCSAGETTTLDAKQFSDGLLLVFLISSVENYFVPLGNLFSTCNKPTLQAYSITSASQYATTTVSNLDSIDNGATNMINGATAIQSTSYTNTQSIQMLHNVNLAFQLMEDAGLQVRQLARPEDIVNGNLKSLLRVLFALFSRYKHL